MMTMSVIGSTVVASLLLGQVGSPHAMPVQRGPISSGYVVSGPVVPEQGPVRTWFSKLFRRQQHCPECAAAQRATFVSHGHVAQAVPTESVTYANVPEAAPSEPIANTMVPGAAPQRMPQGTPPLPQVTVEAADEGPLVIPPADQLVPVSLVATEARGPILPALANKMGRDEKFAWVTGQLEIENGKRILYYDSPDSNDPCKGRVVLVTDADLSKLGQGDLVSAAGSLQGPPVPGAVFVATSVTLIETPWQSGK
jgi:hypothetical protein